MAAGVFNLFHVSTECKGTQHVSVDRPGGSHSLLGGHSGKPAPTPWFVGWIDEAEEDLLGPNNQRQINSNVLRGRDRRQTRAAGEQKTSRWAGGRLL